MQVQKELVDGWTIVHALSGYTAAIVGIPHATAMTLAILYELIEQPVLASEQGRNFFNASGPEAIGNQIVDVGVFYLGYKAAKWKI